MKNGLPALPTIADRAALNHLLNTLEGDFTLVLVEGESVEPAVDGWVQSVLPTFVARIVRGRGQCFRIDRRRVAVLLPAGSGNGGALLLREIRARQPRFNELRIAGGSASRRPGQEGRAVALAAVANLQRDRKEQRRPGRAVSLPQTGPLLELVSIQDAVTQLHGRRRSTRRRALTP